jgi:hypothetical protein
MERIKIPNYQINIPEIPKQMKDKLFKMCIQNSTYESRMQKVCVSFFLKISNYMRKSKYNLLWIFLSIRMKGINETCK